jgi:hypothetical protein
MICLWAMHWQQDWQCTGSDLDQGEFDRGADPTMMAHERGWMRRKQSGERELEEE